MSRTTRLLQRNCPQYCLSKAGLSQHAVYCWGPASAELPHSSHHEGSLLRSPRTRLYVVPGEMTIFPPRMKNTKCIRRSGMSIHLVDSKYCNGNAYPHSLFVPNPTFASIGPATRLLPRCFPWKRRALPCFRRVYHIYIVYPRLWFSGEAALE